MREKGNHIGFGEPVAEGRDADMRAQLPQPGAPFPSCPIGSCTLRVCEWVPRQHSLVCGPSLGVWRRLAGTNRFRGGRSREHAFVDELDIDLVAEGQEKALNGAEIPDEALLVVAQRLTQHSIVRQACINMHRPRS